MAAAIQPALRDVLQREAYILNLKDYSATEIIAEFQKSHGVTVSRNTVQTYIRKERHAVRERMGHTEQADHLNEYIATNRAVAHDAWTRLAQTKANAQNVPGLQSNILMAAKNTATALGLLSGKGEAALPSEVTVKHEFDFSRYDELFTAAVTEEAERVGPRLLAADGS